MKKSRPAFMRLKTAPRARILRVKRAPSLRIMPKAPGVPRPSAAIPKFKDPPGMVRIARDPAADFETALDAADYIAAPPPPNEAWIARSTPTLMSAALAQADIEGNEVRLKAEATISKAVDYASRYVADARDILNDAKDQVKDAADDFYEIYRSHEVRKYLLANDRPWYIDVLPDDLINFARTELCRGDYIFRLLGVDNQRGHIGTGPSPYFGPYLHCTDLYPHTWGFKDGRTSDSMGWSESAPTVPVFLHLDWILSKTQGLVADAADISTAFTNPLSVCTSLMYPPPPSTAGEYRPSEQGDPEKFRWGVTVPVPDRERWVDGKREKLYQIYKRAPFMGPDRAMPGVDYANPYKAYRWKNNAKSLMRFSEAFFSDSGAVPILIDEVIDAINDYIPITTGLIQLFDTFDDLIGWAGVSTFATQAAQMRDVRSALYVARATLTSADAALAGPRATAVTLLNRGQQLVDTWWYRAGRTAPQCHIGYPMEYEGAKWTHVPYPEVGIDGPGGGSYRPFDPGDFKLPEVDMPTTEGFLPDGDEDDLLPGPDGLYSGFWSGDAEPGSLNPLVMPIIDTRPKGTGETGGFVIRLWQLLLPAGAYWLYTRSKK